MGKADGVLILSRPPEQTKIEDAQPTLEEGADAAEAAAEAEASEGSEGDSRPGVLASKTHMSKRNMRTKMENLSN